MPTYPDFKICRVNQLEPGDLFIYHKDNASFVAMSVINDAMDGDKATLTIGPNFPDNIIRPVLGRQIDTNAISFGKEFIVRVPTEANGWVTELPDVRRPCLVLTSHGAKFIRAIFYAGTPNDLECCYIDIASGRAISAASGNGYGVPSGYKAYALNWSLLTKEAEPRSILSI